MLWVNWANGVDVNSEPESHIIIDGHNRYEICTRLNLPFNTVERVFSDRNDVKMWMIELQSGRRNLNDAWRYKLAMTHKEILLEIGKREYEKKAVFKGNQHSAPLSIMDNEPAYKQTEFCDPAPVVEAAEKHNTRKELATTLEWSEAKVARADKVFKDAPVEIIEAVLAGEKSVNAAYEEIKKNKSYSNVAKQISTLEIKPQSTQNENAVIEFDVNYGDVYLINSRHKLIVGCAVKDVNLIKSHIGAVDLLLTDPPYGISYKSPTGSGLAQRGDYEVIDGDDVDYDPSILFDYCKNVITWGANHYADKLPKSAGWIVWDKRDGEQINNNSDCELAWSNVLGSARLFHHKWNGMIKDSERGSTRIHPTQKPIKLFMYCLEMARAGNNVLDLYAGSGVTLLACNETNRTANLVEINPVYAAAMLKRFSGEFNFNIEKL